MNHRHFLKYYLLCGLCFSSGFVAYPAAAKSLSETIITAWKNHPSVEAAAYGTDYALKEIKEEKSAYFPQVNLSATGGRQFADNATTRGFTTTRGAGYSNLWDGTVSVRQGIFDGGTRKSRVDAAKSRKEAAETDIHSAQDTLAAAVASAYIEILRVYRGLSMIAQKRSEMEAYISRLQAAVKDGAADGSELNFGQDMILTLDNIAAQYETDLKIAEAAYFEVVGEPIGGEFTTPDLNAGVIPARADMAFDTARSEHALLQRAKFEAEGAAYEIETEEAEFYPDIDGEISYLKSEKRDLIGGEAEDARAVLRMNWNFETGGGAFHRVSKRKFRHEQALAQIREIERRLERDIKLAYAEYEGALKQLQLLNERLDISRQILNTNQEQFEGARVSVLQLMQAENQLFLTHLEQVNAQHRVIAAQYGILSSMGAAHRVADNRLAASGDHNEQ
jgi:adhesin transport system outer membrane protein